MDAIKLVFKKLDAGLPIAEALANLPDAMISCYGVELLQRGADPMIVAKQLSPAALERNIGLLLEAGVPADFLAERAEIEKLESLKLLKAYGVSQQVLANSLAKADPIHVVKHLKWLMLNGFGDEIDMPKLIADLSGSGEILAHLETLLWAEPRTELILERLASVQIADRLELFYSAGVTAEQLACALEPYEVFVHAKWLTAHGAKLRPNDVVRLGGELNTISDEAVEFLLSIGASPFKLATVMSQKLLDVSLERLCNHGLDLSMTMHRLMTPEYVISHLYYFSELGYPLNRTTIIALLRRVPEDVIWANFGALLDAGLEVDELIALSKQHSFIFGAKYIENILTYPELYPDEKQLILDFLPRNMVARNLELLEENDFPVDVQKLVTELGDAEIEANLDILLKYGAEIDVLELVKRRDFDRGLYSKYLLTLLAAGIDPDFLVNQVYVSLLAEYLDLFLEYGANPNIIALLLCDHWSVDREKLLAHGATMWLD